MHKISDEDLLKELKRRFDENKKSLIELQRLNSELKTLNKKLEESEALKSHFISNITNEIENPFTSVLGLTESILSVDKENWKKVISFIALIHSEVSILDFQLKNIFAAAKLEAGEITPEIMKVDIKELIQSVIDSFKFQTRKRKINIIHHFDESLEEKSIFYFKTDPEKLKLIISNLLNNSIKFSKDNSNIEIKTTKEKNNLKITVKDYGKGISEENKKIIFDRFKRGDSAINSINQGHGLGLSVNKAVLDLLEGDIEFTSKENEGSTFIVKIPESKEDVDGIAMDGNKIIFDGDEIF